MDDKPLGPCRICGVMQYDTLHDHRPLKTLTPKEAVAHWETRRGIYDDALEPR
jgi:hypothetical protein